jgi:hypothetical protein
MVGALSFFQHSEIFKTELSAGRIMANEFLNSVGVIRIDFLARGVTINAQYYSNVLHSDVRRAIRRKRLVKLSNKINALHDSARPH